MSFQVNVPPSMAVQMAKLENATEPEKRSREDWKKLKELEEARKAGTAPAMQDEAGKDINPHIPQYIMQAPWYFGAMTPTLRHQRQQDEKIPEFNRMGEWYKRGVKSGPLATKFRKGACENCGAMTHKKKDCLERPRRVGAKYTGSDIAPDEHAQPELSFAYDVKRDRWNGYDTTEHEKIIKNYQKLEEAKRLLKEESIENEVMRADIGKEERETGDSDDEDKYADDVDMPGQKFETKQRITVRNLRIREDTAKYLYNLDPNSAFYDPKTRSMRENPFKNTGLKEKELQYTGDNFVRFSGDAHDMAKQQLFAWEAYEKGAEVHLQADPTKLELLTREYHKKKENFETEQKDGVLQKYGGEEHLNRMPRELLLAQTEDYVEYSRHGTVIKGQEKAKMKSIYEEDVYINNHTSVWGSFWREGHWGYKCCYSFVKESYCTGEAGRQAAQSNMAMLTEAGEPSDHEEEPKSLLQQHQEKLHEDFEKQKKKKKKKKHRKHKKKSGSDSDMDEEERERLVKEQKLKEALLRQELDNQRADKLLSMDERKRPYNSMFKVSEPTEEEMEAFRLKKQRFEDPMSQFQ